MNKRFLILTLIVIFILTISAIVLIVNAPVTIHVRIAEDGGFQPDRLQARQGVPLHLRVVADDVPQTFAVGKYPMEPVNLEPGKPAVITLVFNEPGTYTYYSTTPSSINFWRVRGTIEVVGDGATPIAEIPLYMQLGLDLDGEHDDEHNEAHETPSWSQPPSAKAGSAYENLIPVSYFEPEYYLTHSPREVLASLEDETALASLSESDLWNIVAFIWQKNTSPQALAEAAVLYESNCAACHGESGAGDGKFAAEMGAIAESNAGEHGIEAPTDFTSPEHLLDDAPVILQGLILRGGMGNGMPMWGSIFTDQQMWDLAAYLYTFQFK